MLHDKRMRTFDKEQCLIADKVNDVGDWWYFFLGVLQQTGAMYCKLTFLVLVQTKTRNVNLFHHLMHCHSVEHTECKSLWSQTPKI